MSELMAHTGWLTALACTAYFLLRNQPPFTAKTGTAETGTAATPATLAEMMQGLDAPLSRSETARRMIGMIQTHATNEDVSLFCIAVEPDGMTEQHSTCDAHDARLALDALLDLHDKHLPGLRHATSHARQFLGLKVSKQ